MRRCRDAATAPCRSRRAATTNMSSPERGPTIAVALNRRAMLKPLRQMNGDDLISLMRHTRDNRAEMRRETRSSEGVVVAEMNRQLRMQYREHRRNLEGVSRQQQSVYETMAQLAEIKKRLGIMENVAAPSTTSTAAPQTDRPAAADFGNASRPDGGGATRTTTTPPPREATGPGPLCPLLRHAVNKALNDGGSGSVGDRGPHKSESRLGDAAAAAAAAAAAEAARALGAPSPGKGGKASVGSATSPIREALRRLETGAFVTAGFARPRNLPPIDEAETYPGQRARTYSDAVALTADASMTGRIAAAATRRGESETEAVSGHQSNGSVGRGLTTLTRQEIKRILDSEPCPIHRLTDDGSFKPEPDAYVRKTFKLTPEHNHYAEVKRIKMLEQTKRSRRKQASLASEFFSNLFPERAAAVVAPLEESPASTPPPQKQSVRPRVTQVALSSLADCGYLRQYVRPSARPRTLTPLTSWKQRS